MEPKEFHETILETIAGHYDFAWTLEADTKKGRMPIGVAFGVSSGPMVIFGDTTWLPWASRRNRVEGLVNFFSEMRHQALILGYSNLKDKKLFEHIARHGVIRRVGTIHGLYEDEPAALFQTRQ